MLETYTLVHQDGSTWIYDPHGNTLGNRQLWIQSVFDLPRNIPAPLLLGILQFLSPVEPLDVEGFSHSQIQNSLKMCTNARYIFTYINQLQEQVGALESSVGVYPPSASTVVSPGVYQMGSLYFTRYGRWVHISRNKSIITEASTGSILKPDMPSSVKSFSSAGHWKRRVATYIMEHS